MDFKTAVTTCLKQKYLDFQGRAPRSEYWFWVLFYYIVYLAVYILGNLVSSSVGGMLALIVGLGFLLPSLAVAVRRLHDMNRSGWWLLICLVPIIGALVLLFWFVQRGTVGSNQFGDDPLGA